MTRSINLEAAQDAETLRGHFVQLDGAEEIPGDWLADQIRSELFSAEGRELDSAKA
mgnify:CR=1 FL=1